jgi:hypothetical protein
MDAVRAAGHAVAAYPDSQDVEPEGAAKTVLCESAAAPKPNL